MYDVLCRIALANEMDPIKFLFRTTIFTNVADPDPFHIGFMKRIRKRIQLAKNQPKSWKIPQKSTKIIRISYIFFKDIKLMFNGHKY